MRITTPLAFLIAVLVGAAAAASAADDPRVGEVRSFAIAPSNTDAVSNLHRDGWMGARGQLLQTAEYPELFKAVGRARTSDAAGADRFAIPQIQDRSQRAVSSDNPFGVLGPGDLITGGRVIKAWLRPNPLSYWIFVGREVHQADIAAVTKR